MMCPGSSMLRAFRHFLFITLIIWCINESSPLYGFVIFAPPFLGGGGGGSLFGIDIVYKSESLSF